MHSRHICRIEHDDEQTRKIRATEQACLAVRYASYENPIDKNWTQIKTVKSKTPNNHPTFSRNIAEETHRLKSSTPSHSKCMLF